MNTFSGRLLFKLLQITGEISCLMVEPYKEYLQSIRIFVFGISSEPWIGKKKKKAGLERGCLFYSI